MPYAELAGLSLHFEDSSTDGPPVLLLHELGGTSESWAQVTPLLAEHRRVIAMDYRCAGRSEKPVEPFALECLADDAAAHDLAQMVQGRFGFAFPAQDHEVVRIGHGLRAEAPLQPELLPPPACSHFWASREPM
jgi:pimeloyl-ACP methyl ester carboxylesterase